MAEPLAAPFARPGFGAWNSSLPNSVLTGTSMLSVQFTAADGNRPLQQIDLFVDDKFFSTVTNLGPRPGNLLNVTLNGYPITYTVSTNETLASVSGGLAATINGSTTTNATKVKAVLHGDRIELQSIATNLTTIPFYVVDVNSTNLSTNSVYNVTYLPDSLPPRMIPVGPDKNGVFQMELEIPSTLPYVITASTNLLDWLPIWTNWVPGLVEFQDPDSTNYAARFYRMTWPVAGQPPAVSVPGITVDGAFQMHVESVPGLPCAILNSSNLVDWVPVLTNELGGAMDFVDYGVTNSEGRFYRAWQVPPVPPAFTVLTGATAGTLVRVDSAVRPYTVEVSTNEEHWTTLYTNFAIGKIQTAARSTIGDANTLSTFLTASRPTFDTSDAFGFQKYTVGAISAPFPVGSWIQLTITKTNNESVVVAVTNQVAGTTAMVLAAQLCAVINSNSALQSSDGVVAEDYLELSDSGVFNLRARSPGFEGAQIRVVPKRYPTTPPCPVILPSSQRTLTQNLSDLEPRNHLYVTAGANNLAVAFPLDTTLLADGYHELTAVAYEGSHVRTQTRVTVPVWIQNSSLSATMTLLDLADPSPVQGTYHIQVVANTNDVSLVTLFSTGDALGVVTNEATATFEVNGTNLWAGLHPFYAVVETPGGLRYRTETHWVRLVNGP